MVDGFNALLVAASYLENKTNENPNNARGGLLLFLYFLFCITILYIQN